MSMFLSEGHDRKAQIAEAAQAVLDGTLGVLEGAGVIAGLRLDVDPEQQDPDLLEMAGVASQTDHLLLGDLRWQWPANMLEEKEAETADWESFFRGSLLETCRALVERYGNQPRS